MPFYRPKIDLDPSPGLPLLMLLKGHFKGTTLAPVVSVDGLASYTPGLPYTHRVAAGKLHHL